MRSFLHFEDRGMHSCRAATQSDRVLKWKRLGGFLGPQLLSRLWWSSVCDVVVDEDLFFGASAVRFGCIS